MELKKIFKKTLTISAICLMATSFAQEAEQVQQQENKEPKELPPIIVTGVRTNAKVDTLGQSVTIIEREQIEKAKLPFLTDLLMEQPGINFYSAGPRANTISVNLRGMRHYHTKLLIDGVPYLDNSYTAGLSPMLDSSPLNLVERVEIIKGAVSLQGSAAMGGVINVITRKPPEDENLHGALNMEAGSHGRFDTSAIFYGRKSIFDYKIGIGRQRERGISAIRRQAHVDWILNDDDDHYRSMNYFADFGAQLDEHWRIELGGSFTDTDEEYDGGSDTTAMWGGKTPDDDDIWIRKNMAHAKIEGKGLFNDSLDLVLSYAQTRADRKYENIKEGYYRYIGDLTLLNAQAIYRINDWNTLTAGIDFQTEQIRGKVFAPTKKTGYDERYRSMGYYLGYQMEPVENLFLNANLRYNHHSDFEHEWTGDVSARYLLAATGTSFHTSYGKGYRAPNAYELMPNTYLVNYKYWGAYKYSGNPDLKPEKSRTWDFGIEQEILDKKLTVDVTYFQNSIDDYIDPNGFNANTFTTYPINIDKMKIRGIEAGITAKPVDDLSLRLAYTWQHFRNLQTGNHFGNMLPDHKFDFEATWTPFKQLDLNLGGTLVGPRQNGNGVAGSANKMHNYCLMHATAAWHFTEKFKVYGRIDNLLNENYATYDAWGTIYNTYGRVYYVGMTYEF